jgi:hypothetical protein
MAIKRHHLTLLLAATATVVSIAGAPVAAADTSFNQQSCTSQTDTNTACQWPSSTSAQTDNTPNAPYQSQTPYNLGPR